MGFVAILFAILLGLLANEVESYLPMLNKMLNKIALALLTPARRERYRQEWPLVLKDAPGELTRIIWSLSFIVGALLFRIGDGVNYLKPRLLRCVPILDERKFYSMWLRDIAIILESSDVTLLEYSDTPIGEEGSKRFRTCIRYQLDGLTREELRKKLGLSPADDLWQLSPPVKLLRRGYGLLTKLYRGRKPER
jgi:hypothetical protein